MGVARTIAKNTVFSFVTSASDVIVTMAVGIVLARLLGPEEYGQYAFLMWFLLLAGIVVNLGLGNMAKRFVAEAIGREHTSEVGGLCRLALSIRILAALVVTSVVVALSGLWAKLFGDSGDQVYYVIIAFALLPNVLNFLLTNISAGFQKYEYGAYIMLGSNPLRAVMVIGLAVLGFGVRELLIANLAAYVVGAVIGLFLLRRLVPLKDLISSPPLVSTTRRRALKFALTMAGITAVTFFAFGQGEVLLLGLWCSSEDVGFYRLAFQLPGMLLLLIPAVLSAVLLPALSEQYGRGDMEKIRAIYLTSARYMMMLALPLAVACIALARPLVNLLWGTDYDPVITVMQIVSIPLVCRIVGDSTAQVIFGIDRTSFVFKVVLITVFLNIGLNVWLIPHYGIMGAAVGSSIPRFLYLLLVVYYASSKTSARWPLGDTARVGMASLVVGLALFGVQHYLSAPLALVLSIPLGFSLYVATLLYFRAIRQPDLDLLRGIEDAVPRLLRKNYAAALSLAEWAGGRARSR